MSTPGDKGRPSNNADEYDELFGCGAEDGRQAKRTKTEDAAATGPPVGTTASSRRPEEDELNSDLDDAEEEDEDVDDEGVEDLILCQYEKIHRVRSRWRGVLRSGIIHVAGSDSCFNRSTIDLEW